MARWTKSKAIQEKAVVPATCITATARARGRAPPLAFQRVERATSETGGRPARRVGGRAVEGSATAARRTTTP